MPRHQTNRIADSPSWTYLGNSFPQNGQSRAALPPQSTWAMPICSCSSVAESKFLLQIVHMKEPPVLVLGPYLSSDSVVGIDPTSELGQPSRMYHAFMIDLIEGWLQSLKPSLSRLPACTYAAEKINGTVRCTCCEMIDHPVYIGFNLQCEPWISTEPKTRHCIYSCEYGDSLLRAAGLTVDCR